MLTLDSHVRGRFPVNGVEIFESAFTRKFSSTVTIDGITLGDDGYVLGEEEAQSVTQRQLRGEVRLDCSSLNSDNQDSMGFSKTRIGTLLNFFRKPPCGYLDKG